jgi:WD40 repeat protein
MILKLPRVLFLQILYFLLANDLKHFLRTNRKVSKTLFQEYLEIALHARNCSNEKEYYLLIELIICCSRGYGIKPNKLLAMNLLQLLSSMKGAVDPKKRLSTIQLELSKRSYKSNNKLHSSSVHRGVLSTIPRVTFGALTKMETMFLSPEEQSYLQENDHYLFTADLQGQVKLSDPISGRIIQSYLSSSLAFQTICVHLPKNLVFYAGGDRIIYVCNIWSGKCLFQLKAHKDTIFALSIFHCESEDFLCSGGNDGLIMVWNINQMETNINNGNGTVAMSSPAPHSVFPADSGDGAIRGLVCPSSLPHIFTGYRDGTIRLWEFPSGKCLWEWKDMSSVHQLLIHPITNDLIVAGTTNIITIWKTDQIGSSSSSSLPRTINQTGHFTSMALGRDSKGNISNKLFVSQLNRNIVEYC